MIGVARSAHAVRGIAEPVETARPCLFHEDELRARVPPDRVSHPGGVHLLMEPAAVTSGAKEKSLPRLRLATIVAFDSKT